MTKTNLYLTLSVSLRDDGAVCPLENTMTSVADISIGPAEADDADVVGIADGEQVASSQNSEVFSPALHMSKMIQFNPAEETQLRSSSSTPVTPASSQCFKVWRFFSRAQFSEPSLTATDCFLSSLEFCSIQFSV